MSTEALSGLQQTADLGEQTPLSTPFPKIEKVNGSIPNFNIAGIVGLLDTDLDHGQLEDITQRTALHIGSLADRWLAEGEIMFANADSKVRLYVQILNLKRRIPGYTGAIDVRDSNATPNRYCFDLDNAFARLHELWSDDPRIQVILEEEKKKSETRNNEWYRRGGLGDQMVKDMIADANRRGVELTDQEIGVRELKARRNFIFFQLLPEHPHRIL